MILIVDDDASVQSSLSFLVKRAGYDCVAVGSPRKAWECLQQHNPVSGKPDAMPSSLVPFRLVLLDMNFSLTTTGDEGLTFLRQIKLFYPSLPVILMTAWGSISLAVQGMQAGAFDFVTKPFNNLMLLNSIRTALELSENKTLTAEEKPDVFSKIIGRSEALKQILDTVQRIAPTDASVLITGESGTGKELIAEAIHHLSKRANEAFVKVNLGGISNSLFESEMFGHRKGAFTDASTDRAGRFEMAHKGTIFLDEIGELELSSQVKLLRVLQDQTFEVLGDSRPKRVDIRVISATNQPLRKRVEERLFREDLFYRINLITIHLPPLRERVEDIPLLAAHFANQQAHAIGMKEVEFTPEATRYLQTLPLTGNVRELKNLVERTLLISQRNRIDVSDLKRSSTSEREQTSPTLPSSVSEMTMDEIEKLRISEAIKRFNGNMKQVASMLGISRQTLYRRLEKLDIKNPHSSDTSEE